MNEIQNFVDFVIQINSNSIEKRRRRYMMVQEVFKFLFMNMILKKSILKKKHRFEKKKKHFSPFLFIWEIG